MELRQYQQTIVDKIRGSLARGVKAPLVVAPTGAGKTAIFCHIAAGARAKRNRVIVMVHRQEILQQTLKSMHRLGITAGQIMAGRPLTHDLIQVASVQTLVRRLSLVPRPDLIITDECFPAGQLIDGKEIESISIGDEVESFNHETEAIEPQKIKNIFSREYNGDWYKVKLENGKEIICTEGHQFYTVEFGYLPISLLTKYENYITLIHHELHKLQQSNTRTRKNTRRQNTCNKKILQSSLLYRTQGENENKSKTFSNSLQNVRWACFVRKNECIQRSKKTWIWISRRLQEKVFFKPQFCAYDKNKSFKACNYFRSNEKTESYAIKTSKRKNDFKNEGKDIYFQRWERSAYKTTTCSCKCSFASYRISNYNSFCKRKFRVFTAILQSRYCRSFCSTCNRNRRENAQVKKMAFLGQKENGSFECVRLASIEIYKRGSGQRPGWVPKKNTVYNLHVDRNENYFVNGILVHNCHHTTSQNTWGRIHNYWSSVPNIGFTATPQRLDGVGLRDSYDEMILGPSIRELVADGWLSFPVLYRPPEEVIAQYHIKRGDFDQAEQQKVMTQRKIVGDVIDHYRRHMDGQPVIVSCVSVEHAKIMAGVFQGAGYRSRAVWGDMAQQDREDALGGLGDGSVQVVTFADLIGEGVDIPIVAGVIMLRRTLSLSLYLQIVGRALRPYPGKERAIILDHAGNYQLHGHVLADRDWSLDSKKRTLKGESVPTTTSCPKCYGVWPGKPRSCPGCGFEFKDAPVRPVKEIQVIAGELIEAGIAEEYVDQTAAFVAAAMRADPKTKQKMLLGRAFALAVDGDKGRQTLEALAGAVGYKDGWTRWAWDYATGKARQ